MPGLCLARKLLPNNRFAMVTDPVSSYSFVFVQSSVPVVGSPRTNHLIYGPLGLYERTYARSPAPCIIYADITGGVTPTHKYRIVPSLYNSIYFPSELGP